METIIDFMRHGEPEGGSRYRGNSIDDPLSEKGWLQMRAAVGDVCPWGRVVSSPLVRCHAFAYELCERNSLPLVTDDRFKEVGFGDWEGYTRGEIQARNMAQYQAFYADPVNQRPPGAEPLKQFFARVSAALDSVVTEFAGQHILVVAHAGVVRAAVAHALDAPAASAYRMQVVNAGLSRIRHDVDGFTLEFFNREYV